MGKIFVLALTAAALLAADATGKWTGSMMIVTPEGTEPPRPAHLVLKQEGAQLTGSAGPHAGEQHPIRNGKAEEGNLTFELDHGETTMKFALKQDGDQIKGEITRQREGQTQKARLELKRDQ